MSNKFGEFAWNCYKDVKPIDDKHIYAYWIDCPEYGVEIGTAEEFNISLDDNTYWCYVYMPDAPVIEKKFDDVDLIELLKRLENGMADIRIRMHRLEKRMEPCNPFSDGG